MALTSKTLRIFWQEAWQFKKRMIFSVSNASISVVLSSFIAPYIIAIFLGRIQAGENITLADSWPLIGLYALAQLYGEMIGWRLTLLATWTFETAAQRNLYNRIFSHLTNQSMNFHANRFGGSLVSQTNKMLGAFERFWDTIIFQLTPSVASLLAAVSILSFVFWQYALILFILAIIFTATIILGSRFMAKLNVYESQASTALTGRLADAVTNILAIKSHGHEEYESRKYDLLTEDWRRKSLANMWGFLKVSSVYSGLIMVLNVTALTAAVWATENGMISISVVYLAVTYTFTVARQLWEMNNIMRNFNRVVGDAYDMTEILNMPAEVVDNKNSEKAHISRGDIVLSDVTFAHETNGSPLFKNLSLHIKPGEKVGLIGHSGSGKTTLTKLLLRFVDIQSGSIRIDGQNITKLRQSELRSYIAYVPQEPVLFHRSLKDNIRYGQLASKKDAVQAAAKLAHAHEFISELPEAYETLVGERGVKLSGGQRQRIAIARAILKNAPILVLDEATSALDSESETLIQDALWSLMEGRTAIVIAHRLSTIQKMDRILVMEDGNIVEEGTHKELIRRNGLYASLWSHQSGGFIED